MFNLIVAIISIVLVAVMGVAGIYYGGDVISQKTKDMDYSEISNGAIQIKGAMELYRSRHGYYPLGDSATVLTTLTSEGYLNQLPPGTWSVENLVIKRDLIDAEQCSDVNLRAGFNTALVSSPQPGCPDCTDSNYAAWPACVNP